MTRLAGLEYHVHENGIQEYIFLEATHEAVDSWMDTAIELTRPFAAGDVVCYLIAFPAKELIPLMHTVTRIEAALKERPLHPTVRVAILHPPGYVVSMMEAFVKLLRLGSKDAVRFFAFSQREIAIRWLLEM